MLTLSNIGCKYIKAISQPLVEVYANPDDYEKIVVEVRKNCCDTVHLEEIEVAVPSTWQLTLPISATLHMDSITFRDVATGHEFIVPINADITSGGSFTGITSTLNTYFNTHFGMTLGTITQALASVNSNYVYTLSHIPTEVAMIVSTYKYEGVEGNLTNFTYSLSPKGTMILVDGLIITPQILGSTLDTFEDGVYSISISVYTPSGTRVIDSNCIFIDCNTKCKVSKAVGESTDETEKLYMLMLHYGLSLGTNCACECDSLCDLYKELYSLLGESSSLNSCNCE